MKCPCEPDAVSPSRRVNDAKAGDQESGGREGRVERGEGSRGANKAQVLGVGKRRHRTVSYGSTQLLAMNGQGNTPRANKGHGGERGGCEI